MKILQIHNCYINLGGEEVVLNAEKDLLVRHGHDVEQWVVTNESLKNLNAFSKIRIAIESIWSSRSYAIAKQKIRDFPPDIVHVHNTIPLITSSVYSACKDMNVPVVQTLHNYKFICAGSNLYRDKKVCEACVGKQFPFPALIHGCYRNKKDYLSTIFFVMGLVFNRIKKTYVNGIDTYITLSEFARQKSIEGGLPEQKITVKPNFSLSDAVVGEHSGDYVLYAGRLINQKGVHTLVKAWNLLDEPIPLKIAGKGALSSLIEKNSPEHVEYLGGLPREEVITLMKNAKLLVFPTEWYEVFGLVLIEAFSTGLPVVASRIGGVPEIVKEGESGWLFTPGDAQNLADVVQQAWKDENEINRRGKNARKQYENNYTEEKNYEMIMNIYNKLVC